MNYPTNPSGNLDDEARAELLCYLVVSQLVARAKTGGWLQPRHALESARIWLQSNGGRASPGEWVDMSRMSHDVATQFLQLPPFLEQRRLVQLFTDGWRLDYRNPTVGAIFDVCADHLARNLGSFEM